MYVCVYCTCNVHRYIQTRKNALHPHPHSGPDLRSAAQQSPRTPCTHPPPSSSPTGPHRPPTTITINHHHAAINALLRGPATSRRGTIQRPCQTHVCMYLGMYAFRNARMARPPHPHKQWPAARGRGGPWICLWVCGCGCGCGCIPSSLDVSCVCVYPIHPPLHLVCVCACVFFFFFFFVCVCVCVCVCVFNLDARAGRFVVLSGKGPFEPPVARIGFVRGAAVARGSGVGARDSRCNLGAERGRVGRGWKDVCFVLSAGRCVSRSCVEKEEAKVGEGVCPGSGGADVVGSGRWGTGAGDGPWSGR